MSATQTDRPETDQHPREDYEVFAEPLSQTMRRHGSKRTRVLAVASLVGAVVAIGGVVVTATEPGRAEPLAAATDEAWAATGSLSDALRALRPGQSRNEARPLAGAAADAVRAAEGEVEALALSTSETPVRQQTLRALRADAAWIDAVGSTLANPRSPRRSELAELAEAAATATAVVARSLPGAEGTLGGTGRLLAATKPGA